MAEPLRPGDEAPVGTPGTGANMCLRCNGNGEVKGAPCPDCEGTGLINEGVGGALRRCGRFATPARNCSRQTFAYGNSEKYRSP